MKDYRIPIFAAAILIGYLAVSEYQKLKSSIIESQKTILSLVEESRAMIAKADATIDALKKRLFRAEDTLESVDQSLVRLIEESESKLHAASLDSGLAKSSLDQALLEVEKLRAEKLAFEKRAIEAEQSLQLIRDSKPKQVVKMHSGKSCLPCQAWKQQQLPLWEAMGWKVEVIEETKSSKSWPWFEICDGDTCYQFVGPVTLENLAKLKSKSK